MSDRTFSLEDPVNNDELNMYINLFFVILILNNLFYLKIIGEYSTRSIIT